MPLGPTIEARVEADPYAWHVTLQRLDLRVSAPTLEEAMTAARTAAAEKLGVQPWEVRLRVRSLRADEPAGPPGDGEGDGRADGRGA